MREVLIFNGAFVGFFLVFVVMAFTIPYVRKILRSD